jgi:hypothetical protein
MAAIFVSRMSDGRHFILLFNIQTQICPDIGIFRLSGFRLSDDDSTSLPGDVSSARF